MPAGAQVGNEPTGPRRQTVVRTVRLAAVALVLLASVILTSQWQCNASVFGGTQWQAVQSKLSVHAEPEREHREADAEPEPDLPTASWRNLTDFLQNCDRLSQPSGPPTTIGDLLGLGPALPSKSRDISHLLRGLDDLTIVAEACRNSDKCPARNLTCVASACPHGDCPRPTVPRIGILVVVPSLGSGSKGIPDSPDVWVDAVTKAEANKRGYAARHGYGVHSVYPPPDMDPNRHPVWTKLVGALALIHMYDWLWVVDSDALVMNASIPLTHFIDDAYDMVLTRDCNGINGGSLLFRNSEWMEAVLAHIFARPNLPMHEQDALIDTYNHVPKVKERVKLLPNKGLNSYGGLAARVCGGAYTPGDFVIHFPGTPNKFDLVKDYWKQLPAEERTSYEKLIRPLPNS